jgi:putative colanic acid biosynthesis acetyltransferase WcaF
MINKVDLSKYNNNWYKPGSIVKRLLWYFTNMVFFKSSFLWPNTLKIFLLKLFGAKVTNSINLKPCVNIKYPWFIEIGNNVWLGENCWIDNLGKVKIGDNVNISQGVMLLTGNHNYKVSTFDLMIGEIILEDGVWVGAKSIVCPGLTMHSHSVLSVGSVLTKDAEAFGVYQGNPAVYIKNRIIK